MKLSTVSRVVECGNMDFIALTAQSTSARCHQSDVGTPSEDRLIARSHAKSR